MKQINRIPSCPNSGFVLGKKMLLFLLVDDIYWDETGKLIFIGPATSVAFSSINHGALLVYFVGLALDPYCPSN